MVKLRHFLFYSIACLAFPMVALIFICNKTLAAFFIHTSKIEIAPKYTGGKVLEIIDHESYKTFIHEPVLEGCLACSKKFMQIDWEVKPGKSLPYSIHEELAELGVEIDWETAQKEAKVKSFSMVTSTPIYDLGAQKKMLRLFFQTAQKLETSNLKQN